MISPYNFLLSPHTTNNITITIVIEIKKDIQSGASTQTQLHEITPVSFNTINTKVNNPKKPMPLFLTVVLALLFIP